MQDHSPLTAAPQDEAKEGHGALRAFSRRAGNSTLLAVTARAEFQEEPGDKLVGVWWVKNAEAAIELEEEVTSLLTAARFHIDRGGFSAFPAGKVLNLVRTAMTHCGVAPLARPVVQRASSAWTRERVARLGYLIGRGLEAKQVAADPMIDCSPENVHRHAARFGLSFQEVPRGQIQVRFSREELGRIDRLARANNLTREALVRRLVVAAPDRCAAIEPVGRTAVAS